MKINEQVEGLLVKIKSTNVYDPFEKQMSVGITGL